MDLETQEKLKFLGREIAENLAQMGTTAVLPAGQTELPACGTGVPKTGCENLLYAPITVARFYRSGRTEIDQVVEGKIPLAPGSSVLLSQRAHPSWPTGCYSLRYSFANNANHHNKVKIEWFIDNEPLDAVHRGSEIYNLDNTLIGQGMLPVPLAAGEHCCVGGNNLLRVRISHTGNANQIEDIQLYVEHASAVRCCSASATGRACQRGCKSHATGK